MAAALLCGVSHWDQALAMQWLSTIAGIGYGIAYRRGGVPGAIAAHATVNHRPFPAADLPRPGLESGGAGLLAENSWRLVPRCPRVASCAVNR
ncbi:hypothetical protein [Xanthomonas fragariae]|uniref:hypothetical protein n=1 Tax=Xanthomonas fragariae TaxID=48664 RepID=UPI003D18B44B